MVGNSDDPIELAGTIDEAAGGVAAVLPPEGERRPARWTIDGRFYGQPVTGVQRYGREIVRAMDDLLQEPGRRSLSVEVVAPPGASTPPALTTIGFRCAGAGSGHLWEQFSLPFVARGAVLGLCNSVPALSRPSIVCIHDVSVFLAPDSYSLPYRLFYRVMTPLIAARARKVATVSRYSADMLVKLGLCRREKIEVIYNGCEHVAVWDAARARPGLLEGVRRPFVLLLGSRARHKNVGAVLSRAVDYAARGIDIVVAGGGASIFKDAKIPEADNVHALGYVSDDDLAALFKAAACFAFPSTAEGFGIPVLEAMAHGCPVVCSTAASLPEVGGEAAVYVDPLDSAAWTSAICDLVADERRRQLLAAAGRAQAQRFSWRDSAAKFIDLMAAGGDGAREKRT